MSGRDEMTNGMELCPSTPENIECLEFELAADVTNMLQWREILAQGDADKLISKLDNKYWAAHSGKLETREVCELKHAFGVVRDNIQAMGHRRIGWSQSEHSGEKTIVTESILTHHI